MLRNYSYQYDGLNRLTEGRLWDAMNLDRGEYTENLTYDLNGNIGTLKRKGRQFPGYTAPENMDDLAYVYSGNRLTKVDDLSLNPSGYPIGGKAFGYDDNGNMTVQEDKGLSIAYNYLNLPQNIASPQGNTAYVYNADGTKVKKTAGSKVVDYLTGFQYENSTLQFFPTSEGYFDVVKNKYIYNYTDHLGNVRLSYLNSGSGVEIIEESNYYPFGLKHEGYNTSVGNAAYQYKYNGKELQETGMYDYGARFYMPDIGRWGVIDPRSQYTHEAYSYVWNNPIFYNDPTGMEGDPCDTCPGGKNNPKKIDPVVITIYRPIKPNFQPADIKISTAYSLPLALGSRSNNPWGWGLAVLTGVVMGIDYLKQANDLRNQINYHPEQITYTGDNKQFLTDFSGDDADESDVNGVSVPVDDSGYKKATDQTIEKGENKFDFAKSKRGKESQRQKDVKHGGDGEGLKGKGSKGDKHTAPRSGRESTKNRQKPGFKKYK